MLVWRTLIAWESKGTGDTDDAQCGKAVATRIHRLDARLGLYLHVSDTLLRFLAFARGSPWKVDLLVATWGHRASSDFSVSGGVFLCVGDASSEREGAGCQSDCKPDDPPWRRGIGLWLFVPFAGICRRLGMGTVDRSVSRRRAQHHRRFDDSYGSADSSERVRREARK